METDLGNRQYTYIFSTFITHFHHCMNKAMRATIVSKLITNNLAVLVSLVNEPKISLVMTERWKRKHAFSLLQMTKIKSNQESIVLV